MSELLDEALQVLRGMPETMQDTAARAIIDYASSFEEQSPIA
jgi:hypothetical protein